MTPFRFEWKRDRMGYDIEPDEQGRLIIRGREPRPELMQPVKFEGLHPPVHHQFGNIHPDHTAEETDLQPAVLRFVNQFGLLGSRSDSTPNTEESFELFCDRLRYFQPLFIFKPIPNAKTGERTVRDIEADTFNNTVARYASNMTVRLEAIAKSAYQVVVVPRSLMAFIWLSYAQEIGDGLEYRACLGCGAGFSVRVANRDEYRKWHCSAKCRVRKSRKKTKQPEGALS